MTLNASSLRMLRFCYSICKDPLFRRIPAHLRQAMAGLQFQDEVLQIEHGLNDSALDPAWNPINLSLIYTWCYPIAVAPLSLTPMCMLQAHPEHVNELLLGPDYTFSKRRSLYEWELTSGGRRTPLGAFDSGVEARASRQPLYSQDALRFPRTNCSHFSRTGTSLVHHYLRSNSDTGGFGVGARTQV